MRSFNLYRRYRYGKNNQRIENNVNDFLRIVDVHNLDVDFKGFSKQYELIEEMGRLIMEKVKMTNDANSNYFMLHQMSKTQLF